MSPRDNKDGHKRLMNYEKANRSIEGDGESEGESEKEGKLMKAGMRFSPSLQGNKDSNKGYQKTNSNALPSLNSGKASGSSTKLHDLVPSTSLLSCSSSHGSFPSLCPALSSSLPPLAPPHNSSRRQQDQLMKATKTTMQQHMKKGSGVNRNTTLIAAVPPQKLSKKSSDDSIHHAKNINLQETIEKLWEKHAEGNRLLEQEMRTLATQAYEIRQMLQERNVAIKYAKDMERERDSLKIKQEETAARLNAFIRLADEVHSTHLKEELQAVQMLCKEEEEEERKIEKTMKIIKDLTTYHNRWTEQNGLLRAFENVVNERREGFEMIKEDIDSYEMEVEELQESNIHFESEMRALDQKKNEMKESIMMEIEDFRSFRSFTFDIDLKAIQAQQKMEQKRRKIMEIQRKGVQEAKEKGTVIVREAGGDGDEGKDTKRQTNESQAMERKMVYSNDACVEGQLQVREGFGVGVELGKGKGKEKGVGVGQREAEGLQIEEAQGEVEGEGKSGQNERNNKVSLVTGEEVVNPDPIALLEWKWQYDLSCGLQLCKLKEETASILGKILLAYQREIKNQQVAIEAITHEINALYEESEAVTQSNQNIQAQINFLFDQQDKMNNKVKKIHEYESKREQAFEEVGKELQNREILLKKLDDKIRENQNEFMVNQETLKTLEEERKSLNALMKDVESKKEVAQVNKHKVLSSKEETVERFNTEIEAQKVTLDDLHCQSSNLRLENFESELNIEKLKNEYELNRQNYESKSALKQLGICSESIDALQAKEMTLNSNLISLRRENRCQFEEPSQLTASISRRESCCLHTPIDKRDYRALDECLLMTEEDCCTYRFMSESMHVKLNSIGYLKGFYEIDRLKEMAVGLSIDFSALERKEREFKLYQKVCHSTISFGTLAFESDMKQHSEYFDMLRNDIESQCLNRTLTDMAENQDEDLEVSGERGKRVEITQEKIGEERIGEEELSCAFDIEEEVNVRASSVRQEGEEKVNTTTPIIAFHKEAVGTLSSIDDQDKTYENETEDKTLVETENRTEIEIVKMTKNKNEDNINMSKIIVKEIGNEQEDEDKDEKKFKNENENKNEDKNEKREENSKMEKTQSGIENKEDQTESETESETDTGRKNDNESKTKTESEGEKGIKRNEESEIEIKKMTNESKVNEKIKTEIEAQNLARKANGNDRKQNQSQMKNESQKENEMEMENQMEKEIEKKKEKEKIFSDKSVEDLPSHTKKSVRWSNEIEEGSHADLHLLGLQKQNKSKRRQPKRNRALKTNPPMEKKEEVARTTTAKDNKRNENAKSVLANRKDSPPASVSDHLSKSKARSNSTPRSRNSRQDLLESMQNHHKLSKGGNEKKFSASNSTSTFAAKFLKSLGTKLNNRRSSGPIRQNRNQKLRSSWSSDSDSTWM